jgi:hypothetical protein
VSLFCWSTALSKGLLQMSSSRRNLCSSRSRETSPDEVAARSNERVARRSLGDSIAAPEPESGLAKSPALLLSAGSAYVPLPSLDPTSLALLGVSAPPATAAAAAAEAASMLESGGGGGRGMMLPLGDGPESAAARKSGLRRTFMLGASGSLFLILALAVFFRLGEEVEDALVSSAPRLLLCFSASQRICHIPHAVARHEPRRTTTRVSQECLHIYAIIRTGSDIWTTRVPVVIVVSVSGVSCLMTIHSLVNVERHAFNQGALSG